MRGFLPMRSAYYLIGLTFLQVCTAPRTVAQDCNSPKGQIFFSTGSNPVPLVEGSKGLKVLSIGCSNTDPSKSYSLQFSIMRDSSTYPLVTVLVPADAGASAGKPLKAVLTADNIPGLPLDAERNAYLVLDLGDTLEMTSDAEITNGKRVSCIAIICRPTIP